jgi:O-antigen/teichoic acid export membrane protein
MNAYAYIGPGMGVGTIGVVLGVLVSIFLALLSILWYPFKRLFKKIRKKKPAMDNLKDDSKLL